MKKPAEKRNILRLSLLFILAIGCSTEYNIRVYQSPKALEDTTIRNAAIIGDSISSTFGNCSRKKYLRLPDSAHYYSNCNCPGGLAVDSVFGIKHRLIWSRINTLAPKNPQYLFSKMVYVFYDKQGRPTRQTTQIYEPDTNYQFQQYFNELGELQEEKLPLYDYLEISD